MPNFRQHSTLSRHGQRTTFTAHVTPTFQTAVHTAWWPNHALAFGRHWPPLHVSQKHDGVVAHHFYGTAKGVCVRVGGSQVEGFPPATVLADKGSKSRVGRQ
jgi:hypothetical protein